MKYAREVIDCMSAHPGREFRMGELIRYCCGNIKGKERHAARIAVMRVVEALVIVRNGEEDLRRQNIMRVLHVAVSLCFDTEFATLRPG